MDVVADYDNAAQGLKLYYTVGFLFCQILYYGFEILPYVL